MVRTPYGLKGLGAWPSLPDIRDWKQSFAGARVAPMVDLRSTNFLPDVWDQGQLGSCVPHGVDAAYGFDLAKQGFTRNWSGSRLHLYYNGRVTEGTVSEDSGLTIADGIKSLARYGTPPAPDWPYDISKFTLRPPQKAYDDGKLREAVKYARVSGTVAAMQACLTAGTPIVIGFTVYDSFESDSAAATGDIPMPGTNEGVLGGHCMLVVGYTSRANKAVWICRNSWGTEWGDKGYCYMPQAYLTNSNLASDFWTVQTVSSPDPAPVPPTPSPVPDPAPVPPISTGLNKQDVLAKIDALRASVSSM